MEFNTFAEFIAMGRHGYYVWLAYGLSTLILVINVVLPIWQYKRRIRDIKNQQKIEQQHASSA